MRGRFPKLQYRIPRTSGHVLIIKSYQSKRVTDIRIECAAGSQRRIDQELAALGYTSPNTSAVERHNGTADESTPGAQEPRIREASPRPSNGERSGQWGVQLLPGQPEPSGQIG